MPKLILETNIDFFLLETGDALLLETGDSAPPEIPEPISVTIEVPLSENNMVGYATIPDGILGVPRRGGPQ